MCDRVRHHYRLLLRVDGRIRFLSHLETTDALLGALRRAGVRLALSEGMRPKPLIKVAMPRPVAVEAWNDIVEVELVDDPGDEAAVAERLAATLPAGLAVHTIERVEGRYRSAASRVVGATWRWVFQPGVSAEVLRDAVEQFHDAGELAVSRSSPKRATRPVDVRQFVDRLEVIAEDDAKVALRGTIRLGDDGSAKPSEVVRALGALAGHECSLHRTIRERIELAPLPDVDAPEGAADVGETHHALLVH